MATNKSVEAFRLGAKDYLNNDKFSDFTIVCEEKEFKVHRCFISVHSKYFERCCDGVFENARIELKGDPLEAVERMIAYFYTFDYDDAVTTDPRPELTSGRPAHHMQMNAWMFATAEKYEVLHLKARALEKFKIHADVTNADQMLGAAWTINNDLWLPPNAQDLWWAMHDMWLLGGADLAANIGYDKMVTYMVEIPDFMSQCLLNLMGGLKDGTVKKHCTRCTNRFEVFQRSEIMTRKFSCSRCGCTEAEPGINLPSFLSLTKLGEAWTRERLVEEHE